jgi:hypothetical protein
MIRRGFWLLVGASAGIMGYRRLERLSRRGVARETIRFTRDVREGMDLYMARHPGRVAPTLRASADAEHNEKDEH